MVTAEIVKVPVAISSVLNDLGGVVADLGEPVAVRTIGRTEDCRTLGFAAW